MRGSSGWILRAVAVLSLLVVLLAPAAEVSAAPTGASSISGTVSIAGSGEPVANARMILCYELAPGSNSWGSFFNVSRSTDAAGHYAFTGLPVGRFCVAYTGFPPSGTVPSLFNGGASAPQSATPIDVDGTALSSDASVDFALTESVRGSVVDTLTGNPVAGSVVRIDGDGWSSHTQTDADGSFRFLGLPPGELAVTAGATSGADFAYIPSSHSTTVTIAATSTSDLPPLRLERDTVSFGRVVDRFGWPIAGARVEFWGDSSEYGWECRFTAIADADGRFSEQVAGSWTLRASAEGYVPAFLGGATSISNATKVNLPVGEWNDLGDVKLASVGAVRFAGTDRYSTSAQSALLSRGGTWNDCPDVIIANGEDSAAPDPLCAAGLSWAYHGAPVLLVKHDAVPSSVAAALAQIFRANPAVTVHVVGGAKSIPNAVIFSAVPGFVTSYPDGSWTGTKIDRLKATGNRYDQAKAIATRMRSVRGSDMPDFALVANGADITKFSDALALSAVSARTGAPILLVAKDSVPSQTLSVRSSLGLSSSRVFAAGGTQTISNATLRKVSAGPRLWGKNRYLTATAIANRALADGWLDRGSVGVAATFSEALVGGATIGSRCAGPLLLANSSSLPAETSGWLRAHKADITTCVLFGDKKSLTPTVETAVRSALK